MQAVKTSDIYPPLASLVNRSQPTKKRIQSQQYIYISSIWHNAKQCKIALCIKTYQNTTTIINQNPLYIYIYLLSLWYICLYIYIHIYILQIKTYDRKLNISDPQKPLRIQIAVWWIRSTRPLPNLRSTPVVNQLWFTMEFLHISAIFLLVLFVKLKTQGNRLPSQIPVEVRYISKPSLE